MTLHAAYSYRLEPNVIVNDTSVTNVIIRLVTVNGGYYNNYNIMNVRKTYMGAWKSAAVL